MGSWACSKCNYFPPIEVFPLGYGLIYNIIFVASKQKIVSSYNWKLPKLQLPGFCNNDGKLVKGAREMGAM